MTLERLKQLLENGEEVELNLTVRARVIDVHNAHGPCVRLHLETRARGYDPTHPSRFLWVDVDEIVEAQP